MDGLYLVAGLGNPGKEYVNTRHNVGFDTIDLISGRTGIQVSKVKCKALIGQGVIEGKKVILAKPQTFMNLSGESIRDLVEYYKIDIKNVLVIYDDVDLPLGKLRVRSKGSAGTHNGMRSVIYHIQSDEFPRIRIGIGKPPEGWELADFVLGRFDSESRKIVEQCISKAADAAVDIIKSNVEYAMNIYNR
ncbi:MAG TPA: aminoacyl-tRNA hydrolase [Clostridiaceae bacterium]|nr:aminoacyl-tRNA hydrolase [Clostridiaceae bacterium]